MLSSAPQSFTEQERLTCLKVLSALGETPERFLEKSQPEFAELAEVRAAANRLIEGIKREVRSQRGQPPEGKPSPAVTKSSQKPKSKRSVPKPAERCLHAEARPCYVCGERFQQSHRQYPLLCVPCGSLNWSKRSHTADLSGRVAVVTGGRIRIGYQTCLKLLRAGATVHASTRFPCSAALRYSQEIDFAEWSQRLTIHGLDLRSLGAVTRFAETFAVVDILINNAAQTIRREGNYYAPQLQQERLGVKQFPRSVQGRISRQDYHLPQRSAESPWLLLGSQPASLPAVLDDEGHPLDLREQTSWTQTIEQIHPVELLEVHTINAFAPFVLLNQLLPAMKNSEHQRRFVINVTAKEGRFAARKDSVHPHTNMAKASLDMLTCSVAQDLAQQGIYVNSVDPGWVSNQQPLTQNGARIFRRAAPLDALDAAARVCDPILTGITSPGEPRAGVLYKHFQRVDW